MVTIDSLEADLVIRGANRGDTLVAMGGEVEGRHNIEYDFVDLDGVWRAKVALRDSGKGHPEVAVTAAEEDIKDPKRKDLIRLCARAGIGLMVRDTGGRMLGGIEYDNAESDLPAHEIFPGPCRQDIVKPFIGQAAVRRAVPDGVLNNRESYNYNF